MSANQEIDEALNALLRERTTGSNRPPARGAAQRVVSAAAPGGTGGGGTAGDVESLTEASVASREYWPTGWQTTDGLFTFPAIKKVVMTNAASETVTFNFANPTP